MHRQMSYDVGSEGKEKKALYSIDIHLYVHTEKYYSFNEFLRFVRENDD